MKRQYICYIEMCILVTIWGSVYPLTKIISSYISPFIIAEARSFIGFIIIYAIVKKVIISFKEAISGILNLALLVTCLNIGVMLSKNPGLTATLIYTQPIFTVILSYIFLKEKILLLQVFGVIIGFIGALISAGSVSFDLGSMISTLGGVIWAIGTVFFKKYFQNEDLLLAYTSMAVFSTLFLIPLTFVNFYFKPNFYCICILILLGVLAQGVGYLIWFNSINIIGAVKSSAIVLLVPVCSYYISYAILGTIPTNFQILGSALVLIGVFLTYLDNLKNINSVN